MIFQDAYGYPVEQFGDGGDSSMRAGIIMLTGMSTNRLLKKEMYEASPGWLRRHPLQAPWNNPLNFTRDQLIPFIAGLNAAGYHEIIRRVFFRHVLRLGFCQDFQEDAVGTWKFPWPHIYASGVKKNFDFADPLLPNDWWCLIKGGRIYPLYLLYPICLLFTIVAVFSSLYHLEQNQIISELSFHPKFMMSFYTEYNVHWIDDTNLYWDSRNEDEYGNAILAYVHSRVK